MESLAESFNDGVMAPLFYISLFGALGGLIYKTTNTLDSMLGYRDFRYFFFGFASARFDDILNFLPARLSILFYCLRCLYFGSLGRSALSVAFRDARKHESPTRGMARECYGWCSGGEVRRGKLLRGKKRRDCFSGGFCFRPHSRADWRSAVDCAPGFFSGSGIFYGNFHFGGQDMVMSNMVKTGSSPVSPPRYDPHRLKKQVLIPVFISVATIAFIFSFSSFRGVTLDLSSFRLLPLGIGLVLVVCAWLIDSFRLFLTIRAWGKKIRFSHALQAMLSNYFLSSITPFSPGVVRLRLMF